ncbi:MAG: serine/threonine-protein phosphatase [Gammaproteobacteria bacterium]|nr:MAG: serine/threonine-protein phosphatase [Gammaproteobacteria bacterium]
MARPRFDWRSASLSHVGKVRRINEDSFLEAPDRGLWAVADGMGGHSRGDLASQLVINNLEQIPASDDLATLVDEVEDQILAANHRLLKLTAESGGTVGTTVVCLLLKGIHGICLWAGDSRLYRLREGELEQLSYDHSQINLLLEQGIITEEEAVDHPAANLVTRAVGADSDLYLDIEMWELADGDRYLLCSDGLDKHVTDAEIAGLLSRGEPGEVAGALIDLTLERGATDNVTVIVVEVFER